MLKKVAFLWLEIAPKVHVKLCVTYNCSGLQLQFWVVLWIELPLQHCFLHPPCYYTNP